MEKYKSKRDDGTSVGPIGKIIVIVIILILIYVIYRTGGGGQDWYRGKP